MYAISGNAKNNIYATSGDTIYCAPHQDIPKVRHIRKYRCTPYQEMLRTIYTPHQEIQYIVRHIMKYKKCATSGITGYTPYQEMLRTIYTPHQEIQYIVRHIKKYKKYATSRNTVCASYHEMLCMCKKQYIRHIRRYNILYATLGNTRNTSCQEIQNVHHIRKCSLLHATSGNARSTSHK